MDLVCHCQGRRDGAGWAGAERGPGQQFVGDRAMLPVEGENLLQPVFGGEGAVLVVILAWRRPGQRVRLAGEDLLEPEALGMREMLDHAQGCPSARHDGLADAVFVEALNDR